METVAHMRLPVGSQGYSGVSSFAASPRTRLPAMGVILQAATALWRPGSPAGRWGGPARSARPRHAISLRVSITIITAFPLEPVLSIALPRGA
jgi:hypothetical protein